MARFDVHRMGKTLVLDVQADVLDGIETRIVIPLSAKGRIGSEAFTRLRPTITLADEDYVLATTDLAVVPTSKLGSVIENVEDRHRDDVTAALDFLFQGF